MNINKHQAQVIPTDKFIQTADSLNTAILALINEIDSMLNKYKKTFWARISQCLFILQAPEGLSALTWHITSRFDKLRMFLDNVSKQKFKKHQELSEQLNESLDFSIDSLDFDRNFPRIERLPRKLEVQFIEVVQGNSVKVQTLVNGEQIGNELTDNSYDNDGYRFHDVFHLSYAAILGWSPVVRHMLGCKRKSNPKIDEVEDGGRAKITEEAISLLIFSYAKDYNFLEGITALDGNRLKAIKKMTSYLEVAQRSLEDWERAILMGYDVWRQVSKNLGGTVIVDLDARSITYRSNRKIERLIQEKDKFRPSPAISYPHQKCG